MTDTIDDVLERKINRMVKQAIALTLGEIKPSAHGQCWPGEQLEMMHASFECWCANRASYHCRTPSAVRIKLIRYLRRTYPIDFKIGLKD